MQCVTCSALPATTAASGGAAGCGGAIGEDPRGVIYHVEGYAFAGGGRAIERVDLSADGGRSWPPVAVALEQRSAFGWCRWAATLRLQPPCELVVRAWDTSGNTQPENMGPIWNPKGVQANAWHRLWLQPRPRL